jgi:CRP-like cAMP-binding protein
MIKKGIDAFWSNIFSSMGSGDDVNRIDILKRIPIFQDLSKRELRIISQMVYDRSYEEGEFMFETGQPGAAMFVIENGEAHIVRKNMEGEEILLARLKDGEFLGELALLDSSPRSASAVVLKPTKALAIFREDLDKLLETNPELGGKVMKKLAVIIGLRLKATNDLLITIEEGDK